MIKLDRTKLIGCFTLMGLMLVSCGDSESSKDVAYYLKNFKERKQKLDLCRKQMEAKFMQYLTGEKKEVSPEKLEPKPNCKNAEEARKQFSIQERKREEAKYDAERKQEKEERAAKQKKDKEDYEKRVNYLLSHDQELTRAIKECKGKFFDDKCSAVHDAERKKAEAEFEASVQYFLTHEEELQKAYKQCEDLNKLFNSECEKVRTAHQRKKQQQEDTKEKQKMAERAQVKAEFDEGVAYFMAHEQELADKLQACDKPTMTKDLQCRQAREADLQRLLQKSKGATNPVQK